MFAWNLGKCARDRLCADRAALSQILASTLDRYNISIQDAATGIVKSAPTIPGLEPAKQGPDVTVPGQQQQLQEEQKPPQPAPPTPPK